MEVYERTWRQIVTEGREQNEVVSLKDKTYTVTKKTSKAFSKYNQRKMFH